MSYVSETNDFASVVIVSGISSALTSVFTFVSVLKPRSSFILSFFFFNQPNALSRTVLNHSNFSVQNVNISPTLSEILSQKFVKKVPSGPNTFLMPSTIQEKIGASGEFIKTPVTLSQIPEKNPVIPLHIPLTTVKVPRTINCIPSQTTAVAFFTVSQRTPKNSEMPAQLSLITPANPTIKPSGGKTIIRAFRIVSKCVEKKLDMPSQFL